MPQQELEPPEALEEQLTPAFSLVEQLSQPELSIESSDEDSPERSRRQRATKGKAIAY